MDQQPAPPRNADEDFSSELGYDDQDREIARKIYAQINPLESQLWAATQRRDQAEAERLRSELDELWRELP